ncbi:MAG: M16 family metallopeptidase [Alphaproteobacteria bacterium]
MNNNHRLLKLFFIAGLAFMPAPVFAAAKAKAPPAEKHATPPKIFNAERFELDNGMEIVVIPNHRAPVVTHMVWYRVGAADEAPGQSGIAHFLEHLMFKGSDNLGPGEFSKIIRSLGGNDNAFTSHDYTAYFQSIAADQLRTVMKMEAWRMRGLKLAEEQVTSERDVILEERRQRIDSNPQAQFNEQMSAALYVNHPYGTPVIGWLHEMKQLTQAYARDFYDHHYGPNNAILVVSGDVTGQRVYELAQEIYGPLAKVEIPVRDWRQSPPASVKIKMESHRPDVRQPAVQKLYRAPGYRKNPSESLALQVLSEIMGGGPTSRLYKALVVNAKLATDASFSYKSEAWDDTEVWMGATLAPGVDVAVLDKAIDDQLRLLIKEGVSAKELSDAQKRMQAAAIYARDSLSGPPMIFGSSLITGSTIDDIEYWPSKIAAVTADQILQAARNYLDPDAQKIASITGYLMPPEENAPANDNKEKTP